MKKIFLYLLLACLFGATKVWADSGLYLFGIEVPSTSDWSCTTKDFLNLDGGLLNGTISYDAETKTMTFDYVQAVVYDDTRILYNKNVPDLKIVFNNWATLISSYCVFRLDKDTEIQGPASDNDLVTLEARGNNSQCIYCPNQTMLTIRDFGKLKMTSKYWRAMETNGTLVTITNSRIYAEGADCAIQNNKGNDNIGWLHLDGCLIRDIWRERNGSVGERYEYGLGYRVHTDKAKSVMIILDEDYLGVRLKGVALTKGWSINTDTNNPSYGIEDCYTYDESTKTLTLKEDIQGRTEFDDDSYARYYYESSGILVEEAIDININGDGHFVSGLSGISFESGHIVSLSNMIIAGNYKYGVIIYSNFDSVIDLTLKDDLIIGGVEDAIFSQDSEAIVRFNPSAGKTVMLVPCDEDFKEATTFTYKPVSGCSIQLVDCIVTTPEGGEIGTNGFEVDGEKVKSKVVITGYEEYDLWVGETQVTSLNASDILGDGGHFRYNASTKTLTISNATFENGPDGTGIKNEISDLTFNIVGTNFFNTRKDAIYTTKSINFTGNGSLNVNVINPSYHCIYLASNDAITCTINGPQLDFTGGSIIYDSRRNATINVTGTGTCLRLHPKASSLAFKNLKALNLGTGLYISEPIGGYFDSNLHGITVNGTSLYNGDVVISNVQNRKLGFSINGTEMTTLNMNNVPGVVSGYAYITLNSNDEPTLVLENATLECDRSTGVNNGHYGSTFNIIVVGDCTITGKGEMFNPLYLDSETSTTIKGGGTLNLISANENGKSGDAIYSGWEARLTLTDYTTVIAKSIDNSGYYDENDGRFTIDSGYFCAYSEKWYPLWLPSQFLLGQGVDLRYPAGGQVWGNYVYGADGAPVQGDWVMFGYDSQVMDELITGVSPLGETEEGAAIYNLAGQRLSKPQKGINIKGGKKYLQM